MLLLYHPLKPGALITGRLVTPVVERHLTLKATTVKELDSPLAPVFLIGAAAPEIRHGEVHEGHKVCRLVSAEPREVAGDAAVQTGGKQVVS
jgi:hypothetical protein